MTGILGRLILWALIFVAPTSLPAEDSPTPANLSVKTPEIVLQNIDFSFSVQALDEKGNVTPYNGPITVEGVKTPGGDSITLENGQATVANAKIVKAGKSTITAKLEGAVGTSSVRALPGFMSLLPALFAILVGIFFRHVVLALVAGIWIGACFLNDFNPFTGFFAVIDRFLKNAVADPDHASVLIFTLVLGGMVAVIYRNGGTQGIVDWLSKKANNARSGQIASWVLGLVIFFDDYINLLIVGNTMRPLTDRLKISREKLSFIVDSTAAPIASLALVSTWIGTEVGLIGDAISKLPIQEDAYSFFLASIPYRFYPLLMLFLGFYVAYSDRDLFSMSTAERRARKTGEVLRPGSQPPYDLSQDSAVQPKKGIPNRAYNAVIPILTVIAVTLIGLWVTGTSSGNEVPAGFLAKLRAIVGNSDSYKALLWATLTGSLVAVVMTISQKLLSLGDCLDTFVHGLKSMMLAAVILVLAWSIGAVTTDLQADKYLVSILSGQLAPQMLPVLIFITAALISFATGTSWGTMAILIPIGVPLAYTLATQAGLTPENVHLILVTSISSILAGAVFGDHCSPISETTVISSIASSCDHIDHVKTQLPYAIIVAIVGMAVGDIPTAYGMSPLISLILGSAIIFGIFRFFGKPNEPA